MRLKIFYKNAGKETVREEVSPHDNSTLTHAAMGEHVLSLSFTLNRKVVFEVNDYVEFEGNTYTLIEKPDPAMKSNQEWVYDLKFYGIEAELQRALVLKMVDGEDNPVFSLTGKVEDHLADIVRNIQRIKGNTHWKATNATGHSGNIVMNYNGTSCYDALTELANQLNTEWWVNGMTIVLGECRHGDPVKLSYQNGLVSLNRNDNENVKFFTRLYPIGGTRNINPKQKDIDNPTGYGFSRLQLPEINGKRDKWVDVNTEFGIIEHFEEAAFAHIYPRITDTTVTNVKKENSEDGSFTVYYIQDNKLPFDPGDKKYEVPGETKHIVFQSGELNGYDFEVNYKEGWFEIINQYPEGFEQLPGGNLIPKKGDEYLLYNIYLPEDYYTAAEQEFKKAVDEYMEKHKVDKAVYQGETDYIDIQNRQLQLKIGQKVELGLSDEDIRESRITSITKNVNTPTKMTLVFSDVIAKGKLESLQQEIADTMNFAQSNSLPDIVRSIDNTPPSDYNLYSSLKSVREFLSKKYRDTAEGEITFKQGIKLGNYDEGILGSGGAIQIDEHGSSRAEFDFLNIRKKATFTELEIKELKHIGGEVIISPASMLCSRMEERENAYRCYFETTDSEGEKVDNFFSLGDQARCQRFKIEENSNTPGYSHYYWRLVTDVGKDYIDLSKTDCDGIDVPQAGDKIVQLGNRTNQERQNAQILSAYGSDAPSFKQYAGINSFSLENRCLTALTAKGNFLKGDFLSLDGNNIHSRLEMLEGHVSSEISSIKNDFIGFDSYLYNSYFHNNLIGWKTQANVLIYNIGGKLIWANEGLVSNKNEYVGIITDGPRSVLYINNSSLTQENRDFETHPLFEKEEREDANKKKENLYIPKKFYIGFNYKCIKSGRLKIIFSEDEERKKEFHTYEPFSVNEEIHPETEDGYGKREFSGFWNGSGDFTLSFEEGEMYIYGLRLTEDKLEYVEQKFSTKIEQTDKYITQIATEERCNTEYREILQGIIIQNPNNYEIKYTHEKDGNIQKSSALRITSSGLSFITYTNDNEDDQLQLVTKTDIENGSIKISAGNIDFNGLVQINDKVKFSSIDGSLEAENVKITGTFQSAVNGNRIQIIPEEDSASIYFLSSDNHEVGKLGFFEEGDERGGTTQGHIKLFSFFTAPSEMAGQIYASAFISGKDISFSHKLIDTDYYSYYGATGLSLVNGKVSIGMYNDQFRINFNGLSTSGSNLQNGDLYIVSNGDGKKYLAIK